MTPKVVLLLLGLFALPASLSAQIGRRRGAAQAGRRPGKTATTGSKPARSTTRSCTETDTRDDVRQAYQRCLRRYHIVHRHRDKVYRQALTRHAAVRLWTCTSKCSTPSPAPTSIGRRPARPRFSDKVWRNCAWPSMRPFSAEEYFPGIPRETVDAFKTKLDEWRRRKIASRSDARAQVMAVGRTAQQMGFGPRAPAPDGHRPGISQRRLQRAG